jgi:hypothetical protein
MSILVGNPIRKLLPCMASTFEKMTICKASQPIPDLDLIVDCFPSAATHSRLIDWLAFQVGKTPGRVSRHLLGRRKIRPRRWVLRAAVGTVLDIFPEPTCIETGCIRNRDEGTDSTLIIASALRGRGRFFTFEIEPSHSF